MRRLATIHERDQPTTSRARLLQYALLHVVRGAHKKLTF